MKSNRNPLDGKSNRKGGIPYWEKMKPKADIVRSKVAKKSPIAPSEKNLGWDDVAQWYEKLVGHEGSDYHQHVIVPALMKRLGDLRGKRLLDLCCGQGFLGRILLEAGAQEVLGVDASPQLIAAASERAKASKKLRYLQADASVAGAWADGSFDFVLCLLAIHDVKNLHGLCANLFASMGQHGAAYIVMMHPCFRVPQHTHWGWDAENQLQYRRVDHYAKEREIVITTHPGKVASEQTIFYHRSFGTIIETMARCGLVLSGCEELLSHRRSQKGPRSDAEHTAAEEFPMFLMLEVRQQIVLR